MNALPTTSRNASRTSGALRNLGWVAVLCAATASQSAELALEGSHLRVMGVLDGSNLAGFSGHLASGEVRSVVFEDATGGTAEAAQGYAAAIRASGVRTEVRGQCHAACAYAFLAGKEHRFGPGLQINGLLIPVAARPKADELATRWRSDTDKGLADFGAPAPGAASTSTSAPGAPRVMPIPTNVEAASSTPATSTTTAAATAHDNWQPDQGVLFMSTPTLFGRIYNAFYCDGTQGRDFSKCELLPNADPYVLGVLTP